MATTRQKRIGWSLAGEGWGHASRNLIFIREMQRRGYAIDVYTYGDKLQGIKCVFRTSSSKGRATFSNPWFSVSL